MKGYHCGATSRGVDTVQVGHINKSSAPCHPESQKLTNLQTNLHFGPSRDQHWSDGKTYKNRFFIFDCSRIKFNTLSPSLSFPNDKMIMFSSNNFADSWHLWGMDWKVDVVPSITLHIQLSEENGVFKKLSHTNGSFKSAQIVCNQKVGPIRIRVELDDIQILNLLIWNHFTRKIILRSRLMGLRAID